MTIFLMILVQQHYYTIGMWFAVTIASAAEEVPELCEKNPFPKQ
jgi:hypothetical protein